MDAAERLDRNGDRTSSSWSLLPFGGYGAAHTTLAPQSLPRLATIPEDSPSVSDGPVPSVDDSSSPGSASLDPCPGDPFDSGGPDPSADDSPTSDSDSPELRREDHPDGSIFLTRDEFLEDVPRRVELLRGHHEFLESRRSVRY